MQIPPPLHGASTMNQTVFRSALLNGHFQLNLINLQFSDSVNQLKKFSFQKFFKAFYYSFQIIYSSIRLRPHLYYVNFCTQGFGFYRDVFYVFLLKMFRGRILLHLHSKGVTDQKTAQGFKQKLGALAFNNTFPICLSRTLASDLKDIYFKDPFIVPNGIAAPLYGTIGPSKPKVAPGQPPQILFISNYIESKGILILLHALAIVNEKGTAFRAKIVGAPFDFSVDELKHIASNLGLAKVVEITGPLYHEGKFQTFQEADIFIHPTYEDAFPLVILEAMQHGKPVISTREGSIPDIVIDGETGFIVEKQSIVPLADKIQLLLLNEKLRQAMGKKGFERFIQNYTLAHFETNMLQTFTKALLPQDVN